MRPQLPTSAHARCRGGNGEEQGRTQRARNPATLPLKSPQPHRVRPSSVRGPWSAIAVARCPLAGGPTAPQYALTPRSPHIVCSGSMQACENGGPPPLPFWEGRRRIGRGGETPPSLPFSRALGSEPRPMPGVVAAYMRAGRRARARRGGAARLRMVGEEECARMGVSNPGCNYLVRGYSPSMHFFWGGDMPRYSPPLHFRRGRVGSWPRTCVVADAPVPGTGVADVRAGRRVQARALGRGRICARWPAGARPPRWARTGAARLRMVGEEECARTGVSNPGCNYLVRGYSPSMHFFWGGDMPAPCVLASPRGRPARG